MAHPTGCYRRWRKVRRNAGWNELSHHEVQRLTGWDDNSGALAEYMSKLSVEAYHKTWTEHLEYALWHFLVNGPVRYGHLDVGEDHISRLRELSAECGGWISKTDDGVPRWIPLARWQDLYTRNVDIVKME